MQLSLSPNKPDYEKNRSNMPKLREKKEALLQPHSIKNESPQQTVIEVDSRLEVNISRGIQQKTRSLNQ